MAGACSLPSFGGVLKRSRRSAVEILTEAESVLRRILNLAGVERYGSRARVSVLGAITLVTVEPIVRTSLSDGACDALICSRSLDAVHGVVIEEACATRPALEVPEPPDNKPILQSAVLYCTGHLHLTALRTGERLRHRCFVWLR